MKAFVATTAVSLFALCPPAIAADADHALGDHPAVIVKRLSEKQGYDYASKFYRHPAGYYLYLEAPREPQVDPATFAQRNDPALTPVSTRAPQNQVAARGKD